MCKATKFRRSILVRNSARQRYSFFFFFNDPATPEISPLSLPDALPIFEWGWAFAAGFVLLIFVHEMGHAVALRREGIPAGAPVFIPFVGAFVAMQGQPRDAGVEARVAMAAPVTGSLAAWLVVGAGLSGPPPPPVRHPPAARPLDLFHL